MGRKLVEAGGLKSAIASFNLNEILLNRLCRLAFNGRIGLIEVLVAVDSLKAETKGLRIMAITNINPIKLIRMVRFIVRYE